MCVFGTVKLNSEGDYFISVGTTAELLLGVLSLRCQARETGGAAKQAVVRTRPAFCLESPRCSHRAFLAVGLLLISLLEVKGRDVLVLSTRSLGARSGLDSGQGHLCSNK